ncbi:acidic laccase [Kwoniella heveanensis CBS 569]|uniref:Acidic laccase n=1 Tax=Kwoniella heveanensis BCC8398 TaxID=1296120 RepID=A0A1B9GRT5_9TREE|nr:acidic laccase [Kwoniella heveanensis BCC8398]OCF44777.1 acidic laccase [Kwoniella heveanensis CBS 569]
MTRLTTLLATASLAAGVAMADTIEHWWNITYAQAMPDGLQERRVIGINGSWPPPMLTATQGDILIIHATNGLGDDTIGTSLHTHGMFFNGSVWADGAVGTTQCPIPNGQTLDYLIDTTRQTGTYWIHGHHEGQNTDGLRAPFVISPQNGTGRGDNTTWDEEYTLVIGDWYHDEYPDLIRDEFLTWTNPTGAEPVPKSAIAYVAKNGSYIHSNEDLMQGVGVGDNAEIAFEAGKKYRIHIVNTGTLGMFWLKIDGHEMKIIEMDGIEHEPFPIDVLTVSVAQRYSILVEALNTTDKNYALTLQQDTDMYDAVPDDLQLVNTVQIVYNSGNAKAESVELDPEQITAFNDTELVPVLVNELLHPDVEYELNAYFDTYDDGTNRASFNNVTFQMPMVPSMFTALTMGDDAFNPAVYGAQTNAFAYKHMQVIQLTVYNWDAGFHPFHFHGHEFQVVHKSFDVTSDDPVVNPAINENQSNPARRDTIVIPPTGSVTIRWRADNPGAWMFHCHIDWHLSSGLAAIFLEAVDMFQQTNQTTNAVPQQIYDQCKHWGYATEGNIVGKFSTTDFKGQPYGPFPLKMGWTPKAIGALAGCIITVILGIATIVWYASGELDEAALEEEVRYKLEAKKNKVPLWKKVIPSKGQ